MVCNLTTENISYRYQVMEINKKTLNYIQQENYIKYVNNQIENILTSIGSNTITNVRLPNRSTTTTTTTTFSPDNEYEPANTNQYFISTTRPTSRRPTPPRTPSPPQNGDANIPAGCAAALKCVQEIYCTVDGVVSPVPVVLTKEQELLRAPTTVS